MNAIDQLVSSYIESHPREAADVAERLAREDLDELASTIDSENFLGLIEGLTPNRAIEIFELMSSEKRIETLSAAKPSSAVLLLSGLEHSSRTELLEQLSSGSRAELERILGAPEGTAARLMDAPNDTLKVTMTIEQARHRLGQSGVRRARSVYVTDDERRLIGRVDVQDLATHPASVLVSEVLNEVDGWVLMDASRDEIVSMFQELGLDSIPVLDSEQHLVGVLRYGGLFKAIENVASANLQKMVGASVDERALSTPMFAVKRRVGWLHINLLTAFLAAAVVGLFQDLIAQVTALAILLPVVAGQSGNAGSQALAVTMRGIALREVGLGQWRAVTTKETLVGLVNGVALAFTCGAGVFLWSESLGLSAVIAIAMILSMIAAGVSGAAVPMILVRLRQDPATASSIILTTVTDVSGFFAFLGTATLLQHAL